MSANVAIQCTIKRQRPPGGVARVRCAEKKGAYVYHALSAQPGMLIDLTLCTIEHQHENKRKNMLGLNTGPTNAVLRTARRQDKGAKACKQPLLTNCLHFLNNFYFLNPEVSKNM